MLVPPLEERSTWCPEGPHEATGVWLESRAIYLQETHRGACSSVDFTQVFGLPCGSRINLCGLWRTARLSGMEGGTIQLGRQFWVSLMGKVLPLPLRHSAQNWKLTHNLFLFGLKSSTPVTCLRFHSSEKGLCFAKKTGATMIMLVLVTGLVRGSDGRIQTLWVPVCFGYCIKARGELELEVLFIPVYTHTS